MAAFRIPAVLLVVLTASPVRADLFDDVTALCRDAKFVAVGRVTRVRPVERTGRAPNTQSRAAATIEVTRHLKGTAAAKSLDVEFPDTAVAELKPDTDDVIWVVSGEQVGGRYLVKKWKWATDSADIFRAALARIDTTTRTAGMPKPDPAGKPLSVALGADDGTGTAATFLRVTPRTWKPLLVQFENHDAGTRSVMPCMYGSQLQMQFPHYDLELVDANGKPVPRLGGEWCPTVAPVAPRDIVPLARGEVFRESVPLSRYGGLAYGKYKVRLRYTARQDARIGGKPLVENPATTAALKTLWEGELVSNWVELEYVVPDDPKP